MINRDRDDAQEWAFADWSSTAKTFAPYEDASRTSAGNIAISPG